MVLYYLKRDKVFLFFLKYGLFICFLKCILLALLQEIFLKIL